MLKILLVDDDREEYEFIVTAFDSLQVDASVIPIHECKDLPDTIKQHAPDMVFIDINMPSVNGIECLKIVRADFRFKNLPIIIYSTSNNTIDIQESYNHCANLYMVKPDSYDKLLNSLQRVLSVDWNLHRNIGMEDFLIA